jgi:hypothetical protein
VDEGELENALVNLAINARDAMAGGGEVRLVTRPRRVPSGEPDAAGAEMKPGDYVAISVVDQGEGMSEAVQAQALEPFFTTKADRPGRDGSGLGLSIVYGFARASEGHLKIDSRPGEGTSVTLLLPWEAVPPRPEDAVLVLAPEAEAREALADALREIGREAALAADTETALAALETLPAPALLVLGLSPQAAEAAAARARALIPGLPVLPLDVETTPGRPRNPSALTAALRGALASV